MTCLRVAAACLALTIGALAQNNLAPPATHTLESADLEAFFDGVVPLQLVRSDVAGATVLVMQDGKVLLQKGYGLANLKTRRPVDPATTIFRLASISKLFTWVSVMQLEEQGKLSLDTDVNRYLDFQIRPAFGKPITLRNLMTHSSGFEEEVRDVIFTDPHKAMTLRDYLIRNQPNRMFAPGTETAYSNYGVGLAGYIVERVSGEPFERYVADHIFTPLGMVHSSFHQPIEAALEKLPSEGYTMKTTKPAIGFEIFNPVAAGGISSTATDMGRFGQALLQGGELDGHRILKPETVTRMWTPQFQTSPAMPPIAMGFYQSWRDGVHWIGHQGDLIAFHSMFILQPERKLIVFVSYNSEASGNKVRPELQAMFTDRYFPGVVAPPVIKLSRKELQEIEGVYETTRRADSTRFRLIGLFEQAEASIDKEGSLTFGDDIKDLRGHPVKYKPIGKDLWQEVDGQRRVFAMRGPDGKVARLADDFPGSQMERMPWYEQARVVFPFLLVNLAVLLVVVLARLKRLVHSLLLRRRPRLAPQPGTVWLPGTTLLAAAAWVLPFLGLIVFVTSQNPDGFVPSSNWDKWFVVMNVVVALELALSLLPIWSAIRVWTRPELRWVTKVKFSVVALSCLTMMWFSLHDHLIGAIRF